MSTTTSSGTGNGGSAGGDSSVTQAIQQFQTAADKATVQQLDTSVKITGINGIDGAIKKISPS